MYVKNCLSLTQKITRNVKAYKRPDTVGQFQYTLKRHTITVKMKSLLATLSLALILGVSQSAFLKGNGNIRAKCPPKPPTVADFDKSKVDITKEKSYRKHCPN